MWPNSCWWWRLIVCPPTTTPHASYTHTHPKLEFYLDTMKKPGVGKEKKWIYALCGLVLGNQFDAYFYPNFYWVSWKLLDFFVIIIIKACQITMFPLQYEVLITICMCFLDLDICLLCAHSTLILLCSESLYETFLDIYGTIYCPMWKFLTFINLTIILNYNL